MCMEERRCLGLSRRLNMMLLSLRLFKTDFDASGASSFESLTA